MDYNKYFSKNYFQAREKFRKKTKDFKNSKKIIIDNLTIDFALHETKKKEKLIIIVSGTHGVEGYTGSAVQLYFLDKFYEKIKDNYSIVLIHSLNPYGFKHNRRYNENNVDLNRNNLENFSTLNNLFKTNDPITKIINEYDYFDSKRPLNNSNLEMITYYKEIIKLISKYGISKTITGLGFGQNRYPKGVCFSGTKKEKSILALDKYINKVTKGYKQVIFIDIHTGASTKYNLNVFTKNNPKSKEAKLVKQKINNIKNTYSTKQKGLDHIGGLENSLFKNSNAKENIFLILEYGTINKYSTVLSLNYLSHLLIIENQVTHYGPFKKIKKVREKMRKAYSPDTKKFKKNLIKKTELFFKKLITD
jgi:hypothetical protein